jgi:hypothetical protein
VLPCVTVRHILTAMKNETIQTIGAMAEQSDVYTLESDQNYNGGVWSNIPLADVSKLSYSRLRRLDEFRQENEFAARVYVPSLLAGSDYSGGSLTLSNFNVFKDQFKSLQGVEWWELFGGHGTYAIAIRATCTNEEMVEFFEQLAKYPVADEDDMSEVERNAEDEAWDSWIRSDFTRELKKNFNEETIDELTDAELREIFTCGMDRANEYYEHETGGSVFVRLEKVVAAITLEEIENGGDK